MTKRIVAKGMVPFYWDEGSIGNHGFGIMNRSNNRVFDQQAMDAVLNSYKGLRPQTTHGLETGTVALPGD